jgi:Ca2+-binding RTX toxin-like protein
MFFSSIVFLRDCDELSCSMYKDSCLNGSIAKKLNDFYSLSKMILLIHAAIKTAKSQGGIGNTQPLFTLSLQRTGMMMAIVLVIGTMTVGLLPLSPMLIQSAEATTTEVLKCFGGTPTIVGTNNDDVIQGTEGDDWIAGLGGNDRIYGKGGNDSVCGGDGVDSIYGGKGDDYIDGQNDRDLAFGQEDNDVLVGGAGDDELRGDADEDDCENDEGEPVPCLGGNDIIYGNTGDDLLDGGPEKNFGDGGANFDTCMNVEDAVNCEV